MAKKKDMVTDLATRDPNMEKSRFRYQLAVQIYDLKQYYRMIAYLNSASGRGTWRGQKGFLKRCFPKDYSGNRRPRFYGDDGVRTFFFVNDERLALPLSFIGPTPKGE